MSDEHDGDRTNPDLGERDDATQPGVGTTEAFIACVDSADRALAALKSLAESCPPPGAPGRARHLSIYAHGWGELGMLSHDVRRVTLQLIREEEEEP